MCVKLLPGRSDEPWSLQFHALHQQSGLQRADLHVSRQDCNDVRWLVLWETKNKNLTDVKYTHTASTFQLHIAKYLSKSCKISKRACSTHPQREKPAKSDIIPIATGMSVQLRAHFWVHTPSSFRTTVRSSWPTATFPSASGATNGSSCFPVGKSSLTVPRPSIWQTKCKWIVDFYWFLLSHKIKINMISIVIL